MAEFRRDPVTGQWVIVHTERSWSPKKFEQEDHAPKQEATCQFCPGRERFTPPEIEAVRLNGAHANEPGWTLRVVPNKFPALRIEGNIDRRTIGLFEMSNGIGAHEVLIETPEHAKNLADFSVAEMTHVIDKYQSRVIDLTKDKRFKYIIIFRNYGKSAGATVEHAHSQIIALPMVPQFVQEELEGTQRYFDEHSRCVFCDIIQQEYTDGERIITQNDDFITFCPFVPRYPFECWILPKRHSSDFATISKDEKHALAATLKETLQRFKACLKDPSYNYYLHISPVNYEGKESFHWHIELLPKLTQASGFEWGTGFYVVRTSPGMAAEHLREVKIPS